MSFISYYWTFAKWIAFLCICALTAWLALYGRTWLHVIAGLVLACLLYLLRKRRRVLYGAVEIIAGVGTLVTTYPVARQTCGTFAESCEPIPLYVIVLGTLTGIYVVIRGLDNIQQGWTRPPS